MVVNVSEVPEQTLPNRVESLPLKLRTIKSHPYLNNAYSTPPPLPKPLHFHQLSDQTGQSSQPHHQHQLSTISLPAQHSQVRNTNPFVDYPPPPQIPSNFQTPFGAQPATSTPGLNQQPVSFNPQPIQPTVPAIPSAFNHPHYSQIDKPQPIYLNGQVNGQLNGQLNGHHPAIRHHSSAGQLNNIEQYETTFAYNDLDKNRDSSPYNNRQQIYINHPVISRPTDSKPSSSGRSFNRTDQVNGHQQNGYLDQTTCKPNPTSHFNQFSQIESNPQKIYSNHSHFAETATPATYHGLPIKFVKALKKLFDIFDTNKCGLVRIVDIESRINDEEFDEELDRPQDLIDSLRKVTSPNGLINFSNFCAAINICLLKNQLNKSKQQNGHYQPKSRNGDRNDSYLRAQNLEHKTNGYPPNDYTIGHQLTNGHHLTNGHRFPKQSSINSNSPLENSSFTSTNSGSSNSSGHLHKEHLHKDLTKHRSNTSLSKLKLRPSSVPVESFNDDETNYRNGGDQACTISKKLDSKAKSMGNLKEQIYANKLRLCSSESGLQQQTVSPSQIMEKLFEWRNNLLERKLRSMNLAANGSTMPSFGQPATSVPTAPSVSHLYSIVNKKTVNNRKRDEMRRHTVNIVQSNLHNPNTAKLTNMNREKELLQKGLVIIDRAKQFYLRHVAIVQNQIDALTQYTSGNNFFLNQLNSDYNIRQHLDKLNNLEQINRSLAMLIDDQLPQNNRLNQMQSEIELQKQNLTVIKLKEQIQMLNNELVRKRNIISSLEKANPFSVC